MTSSTTLSACFRAILQQAAVKTKLQQLSQMWLFSKDVIKGDTLCTIYTVRPGDSLAVIGKKFKVPC